MSIPEERYAPTVRWPADEVRHREGGASDGARRPADEHGGGNVIIAFSLRQLLALLLVVAVVCFVAGVSVAHSAAPPEPTHCTVQVGTGCRAGS